MQILYENHLNHIWQASLKIPARVITEAARLRMGVPCQDLLRMGVPCQDLPTVILLQVSYGRLDEVDFQDEGVNFKMNYLIHFQICSIT